jgi:hypothetical protein
MLTEEADFGGNYIYFWTYSTHTVIFLKIPPKQFYSGISSSIAFRDWPSGMSPSEVICSYGSYTQSVRLLGSGNNLSQGRYLHWTTQTQKKSGQTSTHRLGFELMIPVFERAKAIHALDSATTVIGAERYEFHEFLKFKKNRFNNF